MWNPSLKCWSIWALLGSNKKPVVTRRSYTDTIATECINLYALHLSRRLLVIPKRHLGAVTHSDLLCDRKHTSCGPYAAPKATLCPWACRYPFSFPQYMGGGYHSKGAIPMPRGHLELRLSLNRSHSEPSFPEIKDVVLDQTGVSKEAHGRSWKWKTRPQKAHSCLPAFLLSYMERYHGNVCLTSLEARQFCAALCFLKSLLLFILFV